MHVKHAKAILVLGTPGSNVLEVIKELTGSIPDQADAPSLAGLTHQWTVDTRYYSATIPIWVDDVVDPDRWKVEFSKPEAKEVVDAVGAWLICFQAPKEQADIDATESLFEAVQTVVEGHSGTSNNSIMLVIGSSTTSGKGLAEDTRGLWEDKALDHGFEFVDFAASGSNEYGERQGMGRVKEALTAHEWTLPLAIDEDDDFDFSVDDTDDLDALASGMAGIEGSSSAMRTALMSDQDGEPPEADGLGASAQDQAAAVDDLGAMLEKILAAKERIAELPEQQRKQAAARTVRDLLKDDF